MAQLQGLISREKLTCLAGEATISPDIFPVDVMEIFHLKMLVFMKRIRIQCVFFFFVVSSFLP